MCKITASQLRNIVLSLVSTLGNAKDITEIASVLFTFTSESFTATTFNLSQSTTITFNATGDEAKFLIPFQTLKVLEPLNVDWDITLDSSYITLASNMTTIRVSHQNTDNFPTIPSGEYNDKFLIPSIVIGQINTCIVPIASAKLEHGILTGIHFVQGVVMASDSNSAAYLECDCFTNTPITIPTKIITIAQTTGLDCLVEYNDRYLRATSGNITATGVLLQGIYPNLIPLFPDLDESKTVHFDYNELLDGIKLASELTKQDLISLKIRTNEIIITTRSQSTDVTLVVPCLSQVDTDVAINIKYALPLLKMKLGSMLLNSTPIVLYNDSLRVLMMPITNVYR
jgi:DNA polymerase III sliding clamp (beta) subunit (PCNA family)